MIRKFLIISSLGLALSGCASFQSFETSVKNAYSVITSSAITPQQAYIAINVYDGVEATATIYNKWPKCNGSVSPCRNETVRAQIKKLVVAGRVARNDVKAYLRANPGLNLTITSFDDLKAATASLQTIITTYNLN